MEVRVRRVGGGFGAKQARSSFSGYATALAAYHIQRPVRMHLTIEDNMEMLGRRNPLRIDYQVYLCVNIVETTLDVSWPHTALTHSF